MKICFLTPEYPHPETGHSGGLGTSIKNLATGLCRLGCTVRVLVYGQAQDREFVSNDIIIQQIKNIKIKGLSWYLTRKKIEKIIDQLHSDSKIDLIEVPDWTGITSFIKPKKCPVVIKLHGSDTFFCDIENRKSKWINRFHEKKALQNADFYVAVSKFVGQETNRIFNQNFVYHLIPNGVNDVVFDDGIKNDIKSIPTILYFGSIIRKKGLLELPFIFNEVVKNITEVKLVLIGRDVPDIKTNNKSTWSMMQDLFSDQAIKNVFYLGQVPHSDIKNHIQRATVCVFPSFAEAFPVAWLEAMAAGKAVVASNVGWATELISNGIDGLLVYPKDHTEFAQKIVFLLQNNDIRNKIGDAAKQKIINNFDINFIAKKHVNYYQKLI